MHFHVAVHSALRVTFTLTSYGPLLSTELWRCGRLKVGSIQLGLDGIGIRIVLLIRSWNLSWFWWKKSIILDKKRFYLLLKLPWMLTNRRLNAKFVAGGWQINQSAQYLGNISSAWPSNKISKKSGRCEFQRSRDFIFIDFVIRICESEMLSFLMYCLSRMCPALLNSWKRGITPYFHWQSCSWFIFRTCLLPRVHGLR